MDGDQRKPSVNRQYVKDLRETWTGRADALEQHQAARLFLGKLIELLVAAWVEHREGANVVGLAATGAPHDVIFDRKGVLEPTEIKFIGTEDQDFERISQNAISGGAVDTDTARDYLLSRLYEAARQTPAGGAVIIVIDDYISWSRFEFVFRHRPIDWAHAHFSSNDPNWLQHLGKLQEKYPNIERELSEVIRGINRIRIFRLMAGYELRVEREFHPARLGLGCDVATVTG
jgi:hypothetical protein